MINLFGSFLKLISHDLRWSAYNNIKFKYYSNYGNLTISYARLYSAQGILTRKHPATAL